MTSDSASRSAASFVSDAVRALETLPLRPLPHLDDIELDAVSVSAPSQCNSVIDVVFMGEGAVGLVALQCRGDSGRGGLRALVARDIAEHHLRSGAETHTVLACIVEEMNARYPDGLLAGACVALFDSHDNRLAYSSVGGLGPLVFRKSNSTFVGKRELAMARVQPLGAVMDQTRLHLRQGDWFVMGTAGVQQMLAPRGKARRGGMSALAGALSRSTAAALVKRVGGKARRLADSGKLTSDVALVALRVPAQSARNRVLRELGFEPDEPVHLTRIHYYEEMDRAAAGVLRSMDRQGFRDTAIRKMKIALAELLVNALEHGNRKDPTKRVIIGYTADAYRVKVSVMDEGDGFKPSSIPDPTLEGNVIKDRGRGLFLARHFVDKIQFNAKANRVTAVKYFHPG